MSAIRMNNETEYKLSVLVAVYNVSAYLDECLESLHKQKRQDVEFIVVDDGSTDGCSEICDQWAARDSRFRVIHQENKGLVLARKAGVVHSSGQWIVFLDGDDMLADDALDDIFSLVDSNDYDTIQYYIDVFNQSSRDQYNSAIGWRNKREIRINKNIDICRLCFVGDSFSFNICTKIFRSSVIKKAFEFVKDIHLVCAEDAYIYFITTFFTDKFVIKKTRPLYLYRLNVGISTSKETIELFKKHLSEITIIEYIKEFLKVQSADKAWFDACAALQVRLTNTAVYRMSALPEKDLAEAFSLFLDTYDPIIYMPALVRAFGGRQNELARAAYTAFSKMDARKVPASSPAETKVVGIFYSRYFNDGVERVISQHILLFLQLGYKVVLFTEQSCPEKEYALPPEVIRVILPESYKQGRADVFLTAMREYCVDVLCHHAGSSSSLLFDLLLCRSAGVATVVIRHETAVQDIFRLLSYSFCPHVVFRLADTVCVLSSMDRLLYQQCGVNVLYLQHPVVSSENLQEDIASEKTDRPIVVWVGRLENSQKNYKEALHIFKKISEQRNDAICYIVGSGDNNEQRYVHKFINNNKLQKNIVHIPYTLHIDAYYRAATVHLLTSSFESFGLVIAEGKMHALPLVTYDLPWLELLKDGKGHISVRQHDIEGAADAVLSILNDDDLRQRLSREAQESVQPFLEYDLASAWKEILDSPRQMQPGVYRGEAPSDTQLLWDHVYSMYQEGRRKIVPVYPSATLKDAIKLIVKRLPFIDTLLPLGSGRRELAKKAAKKIYYCLRALKQTISR